MAVLICAYLAAVYLTADARRSGEDGLAEEFRRRSLILGALTGALAVLGLLVIARHATGLFIGLTGVALPVAAASFVAGSISLVLLAVRRYTLVRVTAAGAVTLLLAAWGAAQYPYLLASGTTIDEAAASDSVLIAVLVSLAVGAVLLVPSLAWLYMLFQREDPPDRPTARPLQTGYPRRVASCCVA